MPTLRERRLPSAEVIAIGDELLSGETVDTNSSHIDRALEAQGYSVLHHQAVPDDEELIAEALDTACRRSDAVITTGGLGPTQDDLTFASVARCLGVELEFHPPTWDRIVRRFESRGRTPTANNRRQALLPAGGEPILNEAGTAPGFTAEWHGARFFVLPGVPREMRWLLEHAVLPRLPPGEKVQRRTLSAASIGESALEAEIASVVAAHPAVRFGYRTQIFVNQVKLLGRGPHAEEALEAAAAAVRAKLGRRFFGEGDVTLEAATLEALRSAAQTVATAESCTGGYLAKVLTDVPGSSSAVVGGVVAYANEVKVGLLGVDSADLEREGAVSETVARQMASGARDRLGATWGVSTTGVAGPGGGTEAKPVGTVWLALAGPRGVESWRLEWSPRGRDGIRFATVRSALDRLRRSILDEGTERL